MSILFILIGLTLLVVGGEFLVRSSVALSFKLKLSKMVIGLTVVSFATSAPELLVSLQAALSGFSDISLGNVIGSNIANIGLVLGITAIITPLAVDKDFYKFNWPVMMLFSIALYFLLESGGVLSSVEGISLVVALFISFSYKKGKKSPYRSKGAG
jgi:cation:H+ antiporter